MEADRWEQIDQIFQAALERAPDQRLAFLAAACGGDAALRAEVEALLAADEAMGGFIEAPALAAHPDLLADDSVDAMVGRRIGPYQILRELSQGGMGVVYLAARADEQYQKQVAIKLVKRGMDADFILRRFHTERQVLASLEHPHIARLLDGGTAEDGRPYFIMEYVAGQPIDAYCDARRLTIVERLKLFRAVCSAVQYAHQKLVIHRDLKPSNILVTDEGTVKLLDFGIAKLLDPERPAQTVDGPLAALRPMTPEYASPEQVRGEMISTASDVYSLGVLLYELLTGHRPYRLPTGSPHALAQVICEQEPVRPSTAARRMEEITTAEGIIERRTPESEPHPRRVARTAAPPPARRSGSYRAEGAEQGAGAALQLGGAILRRPAPASGRPAGAGQPRHAGVANVSGEWGPHQIALENFRKSLLVREALLAADPTNWQARRSVAQSYQRIGMELRRIASISHDTHYYDMALENHNQSLAIRVALLADDPTNAQVRRDIADEYLVRGVAHAAMGNMAKALEDYDQALPIFTALVAADPTNYEARRDLAYIYQYRTNVLSQVGDKAGALENLRKMSRTCEWLFMTDPTDAENASNLIHAVVAIGDQLEMMGDTTGAVKSYHRAVDLVAKLEQAGPKAAMFRNQLADWYFSLGNKYAKLAANKRTALSRRIEFWRPARSCYQRSLAIWLDLRRQPVTTPYRPSQAPQPERAAEAIARCDAAIARLSSPAKPKTPPKN